RRRPLPRLRRPRGPAGGRRRAADGIHPAPAPHPAGRRGRPLRPRPRHDDRRGAARQSLPDGGGTPCLSRDGWTAGSGARRRSRPRSPAGRARRGRRAPATAAASRWRAGRWGARTRAPTAARCTRSATVPIEVNPLPPVLRPAASFGLLDITKFYGATTGGIRTYLHAKAEWTGARPDLRHAVVVPDATTSVEDAGGVRWYRLRGAPIPGAGPYRMLLAPRAITTILAHERPDVVELGSHFLV